MSISVITDSLGLNSCLEGKIDKLYAVLANIDSLNSKAYQKELAAFHVKLKKPSL